MIGTVKNLVVLLENDMEWNFIPKDVSMERNRLQIYFQMRIYSELKHVLKESLADPGEQLVCGYRFFRFDI